MGKKQNADENVRKFQDLTNKSWVTETDGKSIKVGDSAAKIMAGDCETVAIREMLYGETANTWRIAISAEGSILLLKTSRELV
jgi:hypothetical protein